MKGVYRGMRANAPLLPSVVAYSSVLGGAGVSGNIRNAGRRSYAGR